MADNQDSRWHLDKRIPIALILTLLFQMGVGVAWMAKTDARVESLERAEAIRAVAAPVNADRLTRVEVKIEAVQEGITEIKRLIQRAQP